MKKCKICKTSKTKTWYGDKCQKCYHKEYYGSKHGKEIARKNRKIYEIRHSEELKSYKKIKNLIATYVYRQKIKKPKICTLCGKKCICHAHHENYNEPLDILWVCASCHHEIHNIKED